jgi:hypothetical protein
MPPNDDKDWLRQDFLDLVSKFGELERRLSSEIVEYKKTVNNAIGLLSKELFEFQSKRETDRLHDEQERKSRQKRADIKDAVIVLFLLLTILSACSIIVLLVYLLTQRVIV